MLDAGKALRGWRDTLAGHQRKAVELENQARAALAEAERADAAAQQASANANTSITYDSTDPVAAQAAQRQLQSLADAASQASQAAESAHDRLESIRREARDLMDRWEDDAGAVEDALENATDIAPGLMDAVGDAFEDLGEWVVDNLGEIGDIAGIIAAVAGVLSFIPVLNIVTGPIAIAAGAVALLAHGSEMVVEGKWDEPGEWVGLGADVLGVIPGVGVAARSLDAGVDSLRTVDGLMPAFADTAVTFKDEAIDSVTGASDAAKWLGGKVAENVGGNANALGKAIHHTFNVSVQAPVALDLHEGNETTGTIKDAGGYVAGAGAVAQSPGTWSETGDGLKGLAGSFSEFTKALG